MICVDGKISGYILLFWHGDLHSREVFFNEIKVTLGQRDYTLFWLDHWIGNSNTTMIHAFPFFLHWQLDRQATDRQQWLLRNIKGLDTEIQAMDSSISPSNLEKKVRSCSSKPSCLERSRRY